MMFVPELWILSIALFGYLLYIWLKDWLRLVRFALTVPGPSLLPLVGNIFSTKENIGFLEVISSAYSKYGPIVRGWHIFNPIIFILEPKHLQVILGSAKFTDKELLYDAMEGIAGKGILTSTGQHWRSHRKYIQPHFTINIIQKFIPAFLQCSQNLVKTLKTVKEIKITSAINNYLSDVMHEVILGIPVDDRVTKNQSPFIKSQNTTLERIMKPWLMIDIIYKMTRVSRNGSQLHQAWNEFIVKKLQKMKTDETNNEISKRSLLKYLTEISESEDDFDEEDVINEACGFMLTGQDSTAVSLSFTLYQLAKHSDVQDKVLEELNRVFTQSEVITLATLNDLKYLEQCIKESLRLSPSVPLFSRKLTENVVLDNYTIPTGCNVFISPYATHRLPQYFPNPEKFDPERFSAKNQADRHNFAFIPFSAGPRNCIAYKLAMLGMKVAISTLLRNFQIRLVPGREHVTPTYRVTLKAKGGIWLTFIPRESI